jgi:PleD family two-component response regulator
MEKKRVLIVDDDLSSSENVAMILQRSGLYEVAIECDASRALFIARRFRPQIMLLNIDMTGRKGGEVALLMVSDSFLRHVPILFLTNPATASEGRRPLSERGGRGLIVKPICAELLLERVGELTEQ